MTTNSQDDNSEVLESSRSPAEALRQKQAYTIRHTAILAYKHGDITKLELEALLDKLCAAYAATVEREAAHKTALAVLQGLEFYVRWGKADELPAEITKRLAALQGPPDDNEGAPDDKG